MHDWVQLPIRLAGLGAETDEMGGFEMEERRRWSKGDGAKEGGKEKEERKEERSYVSTSASTRA